MTLAIRHTARHSMGIALLAAASQLAAAATSQAAVTISTKPTDGMNCTAGVCSAISRNAVLNVGDLAAMLSTGNVVIQSGSIAKDIEIDAALSWTSNSRLTLDSYHAIAFNKPVVVAGPGAITIKTNDGGSDGDFRFFNKGHVEFWDLDSDLTINATHYALAKNVSQIKKLIHGGEHGERYIALAKKIDAMRYQGGTMPVAPDILEGLGNTISNLTINDETDRSDVGLFVEVGTVRDIGLVNVSIFGGGSDQRVGSIAGTVGGAILNSYVTGSVSATGTGSRVGGLAGANINSGAVTRSQAKVSVSAASNAVGAGGLVGQNDGSISESYATGAVTGGDKVMTGGLVGYNLAGALGNSYATGSVSGGSGSFVGGLTGANSNSDSSSPKITASYATGSVTGGTGASVGGLIGEDLAQTGTTSSYWNMDTSGISDPAHGAGNVQNDPGITGLTTEQLQSGLPSGFAPSIWQEKATSNNGFPYLIDLPPS